MARDRVRAERLGRRAEHMAALWLIAHGWRILERRKRLPMIEVDIVARRGDLLAVVEVKRRRTLDQAVAAVTPLAAARLRAAANHLAGVRGLSARVDLIALAPWCWPRHIAGIV